MDLTLYNPSAAPGQRNIYLAFTNFFVDTSLSSEAKNHFFTILCFFLSFSWRVSCDFIKALLYVTIPVLTLKITDL
jgi:hypothetical protein